MNLETFRKEAKQKAAKHKTLIKKLKKLKGKKVDEAFRNAHEEAFEHINCLECANCCKTTGPLLNDKDIDRLAKNQGMSNSQFMEKYVRLDEDGDWIFSSMPCPFLADDNYCMVYEDRPKACRQYPHTDRPRMKQNLNVARKNALMCPAVAEMFDKIEENLF